MLEAIRLGCTRGDNLLFTDLGFRAEPGTLVRITGPNGCGKTSLLRLLCGLRKPDAGDVLWSGESIFHSKEAFHRDLTYIGHANGLKDELLVMENLRFAASVNGIHLGDDEIFEALKRVGLEQLADMPVGTLSSGQRRRVTLTRLMLSYARQWILDEPFVALDQSSVVSLVKMLEAHVETGGSVVYTSHEDVPIHASRSKNIRLG